MEIIASLKITGFTKLNRDLPARLKTSILRTDLDFG